MYLRARDLLIEVYKVMGLVAGTAVQTYTEPQVYQAIQSTFDLMFKKRFWDHLTDWHVVTVDGSTGLVVEDMSDFLKGWEDISQVHFADWSRAIVRPYNIDNMRVTGSDAMYWTPLKYNSAAPTQFMEKVIKFWPVTATSSVAIYCRTHPGIFVPNDIVPFDAAVLAHGAAWQALDNDGINPTAATKAQQMFDMMYIDLVAAEGEADIGYGGGRTNVPLSIRTL